MLVLKLNLNICEQISEFYRSLFDNHDLPDVVEENCREDLLRFERRTKNIKSQTNAHVFRVEALLRLIADRKTLVSFKIILWNGKSVGEGGHCELTHESYTACLISRTLGRTSSLRRSRKSRRGKWR